MNLESLRTIVLSYLAHGVLKCEIIDYKSDYVGLIYDDVVGVHQWDKSGMLWSLITKGGAKPSIDRVKLILRPMSDMNNELLEEINQKFFLGSLCINDEYTAIHFMYELNNGLLRLPFYNAIKIYDWMLSKRFDVYGLIGLRVAIDINTIPKKDI